MKTVAWEAVDAEARSLVQLAAGATERSYAPYSGFRVGAAFQLVDGRTITGANYESASYGLTCCAERVGLFRLQMEARVEDIVAVAVTAQRGSPALPAPHASTPVTPCGACRQLLYEASVRAKRDFLIICAAPDFSIVTLGPVSAYLPAGFSGAAMGRD